MTLKKEFGEKESNLTLQISQLQTTLKEKEAIIVNLESQVCFILIFNI